MFHLLQQVATKWLRWVIPNHQLEVIEGDLMEALEIRKQRIGPGRAVVIFIFEVLLTTKRLALKTIIQFYKTLKQQRMNSHYLKMAIRSLRRNRSYTIINTLGLTLGVTTFLVISLFCYHQLSYDNFHDNADEIFRVTEKSTIDGVTHKFAGTQYPLKPLLQQNYAEINRIARIHRIQPRLVTFEDKNTLESKVLLADNSFLELFDFELLLGDAKSCLDSQDKIVITDRIAEKLFGTDWRNFPDIIGTTIEIDKKLKFGIAGIALAPPSNSHLDFDILMPFGPIYGNWLESSWNFPSFHTYVEVGTNEATGLTPDALSHFLKDHDPNFDRNKRELELQPLADIHLGSTDIRGALKPGRSYDQILMFFAIAVLILVVASTNYINLATAQASKRAKEVGLRKAIGAKKDQVMWQFLVETSVLTLVSLFSSLVVAYMLIPELNRIIGEEVVLDPVSELYLLGFGLAFWLLLSLLAGFYPAIYLAGYKPESLLSSSKGYKNVSFRMRQVLVLFQFMISLGLVFGVAVVYFQMDYLKNKDLGFNQSGTIVMHGLPIHSKNYWNIKSALEQNSFIEKATFCYGELPGLGGFNLRGIAEGKDEEVKFGMLYADYDIFDVYGFEIIQGRGFSIDMQTDSSKAFVINQTAADVFGWKEPIGKQFKYYGGGTNSIAKDGRVIGVVRDFHHGPLTEAVGAVVITLPTPVVQNFRNGKIAARFSGNSQRVIETLEAQWKTYEQSSPFQFSFLEQDLQRQYLQEEKFAKVLNYMAAIAIMVAGLGLYGLASFVCNSREKEIGIRKVLGANVSSVVIMISRSFLGIILFAALIAFPLSTILTNQWLQNFAYKFTPGLQEYLLPLAVVFLITAISIGYHTLKAALGDPVNRLRNE